MLTSAVRPTSSRRLAAAADAVALVVFVVVGSASHGQGSPVAPLLRTGLPLLGAWFVVAAMAGTYRSDDLRRSVVTWLVCVPLAAVIRSAVSDGPWDGTLLVFIGVALAFTSVFLLAGRVIVRIVSGRGAPATGAPD